MPGQPPRTGRADRAESAARGRAGQLAGLWLALACCTPLQAQDEVPFIATPDHVTLAMLQLARVGPRDFVLDLGSGDGRIVITAARRFGARGLGVEIDPELVRTSREHARRAGVADRAEFREQDLFQTDLSPASVITMYLLPDVNLQLRQSLLALKPGTRIVSHDWDLGDWPPQRTLTLAVPDKKVGLDKTSRLHLWVVPARLAGLWCGAGTALQLEQTYQAARGAVARGQRAAVAVTGRIDASTLHLEARHADRLQLTLRDGRLRVAAAAGEFRGLAGAVFRPAGQGVCP